MVATLVGDLRRLGVRAGDVLVVHSSLSAIGYVVGGAQAVIDALLAAIGPEGTLTTPAHSSDWSDPAEWKAPPVPESWWPVIREECPAYDPYATPMRQMGAIPVALHGRRETLRSDHPRLAHQALGPLAAHIVAPHPLAEGLGDAGPLGRLVSLDAKVVLVGVGYDTNTSLHLAETRATWPGKRVVHQGSAVLVAGERRWVTYTETDYDTGDFERLGAELESTGAVRIGRVGQATARLMRQRDLVDFAVGWFARHRR
jgi:aminoglycoside 3-N-acetyltransferase